ncbi:MAG TPA: addiction module protein [Pirellulales bacterium]|nr:addiction module protein [Pirellulales bacterium]
MNTNAENLYQAALKLSGDERYHLAYRLLESVEGQRDADYEEAWAAEIARRIEEVESGTAEMVSWEEVERMIHDVCHGGAKS